MKTLRTFALVILANMSYNAQSQIIATVQMKEEIEGICNSDEVYALFSGFTGQVVPKCSVSKEEMQAILNEKAQYLKVNPKFKGKGMVGVYINCEGEALQWHISVATKNDQLDQELLVIFQTFNEWTAGRLNGKTVDCSELISYDIKKGKIILN